MQPAGKQRRVRVARTAGGSPIPKPLPPHISQAPAAFTLVELTLVVAIIGIVSAIAIPRYGSARATFRSRSAAIRLATDLNYAGSLAKAKSVSVAVIFVADGTSYDTVINPAGAPIVESSLSLIDSPFFASITPASLPMSHAITFDGFGRPDTQPTIVVTASGRTTSLSISPNGRITVNSP